MDLPIFRLLAAATILSATAGAAEFPANHLFVGSGASNLVYEFDEDGAFVRTIGDGANLHGTTTPAFGPDGRLYVQSFQDNVIAVFEADGAHGTKVATIGATANLNGPESFVFGPNGHLYVATFTGSRVIEMTTSGQKVREIGAGSGLSLAKSVAFGPDGKLYVVDNDDLFVFDPTGNLVDKFLDVGSTCGRMVFGRDGRLYVTDSVDLEVHELTVSGHLVKDIKPVASFQPWGIAIAPNGNLLVTNGAGAIDEVVEVNAQGQVVKTIGGAAIFDHASGLAIAPTRFKATIKGKLCPTGGAPETLTEKEAILSLAPGAQTVLITLPGIAGNTNELSDILGLQSFAFHGSESKIAASMNSYGIHATHLPESFDGEVLGSIELQVKGETGELGPHPKSARGTIHLSGPGGVFGGSVKTTKKL